MTFKKGRVHHVFQVVHSIIYFKKSFEIWGDSHPTQSENATNKNAEEREFSGMIGAFEKIYRSRMAIRLRQASRLVFWKSKY